MAEAATRPTMSFVPIKSEEQLDLQALHRARERLVQDRTRLINQAIQFLKKQGFSDGARYSSGAGAACVPEIPDKARRRSQGRSDAADDGAAGGHG
ncbi:IS110 family transposase, partial [Phaeovulum sp.]|uniref:IS110 family transposase n=1 Tax=Phaeovulum sp. TaxID=2934796 RepID=UPI0039E3EB11